MKVNWIKCSDRLPANTGDFWICGKLISNGVTGKSTTTAFFSIDNNFYIDDYCPIKPEYWAEIEYPDAPDEDKEDADKLLKEFDKNYLQQQEYISIEMCLWDLLE